jgi:hypothetical protein
MTLAKRAAVIAGLQRATYRERGRGPDAFDCWGLFAAASLALFGRVVPDDDVDPANPRAVARAFTRHPARAAFRSIGVPAPVFAAPDGAAVMLSRGDLPFHIGLWLQPERRVLHCCPSQHVVFEPVSHLQASLWRIRDVLIQQP